ncbi:tetratricopeptide repeat protein [Pseudomonas putida]|uniref:tetratricopeptide repeat protein n=1 Tax=Pseudomonas putida TaxID=303 RepID=UPI002363F4AA|nr:tetratricopeptide repeat protein [Pseudomonas putida]MDD2052175.1 tetratricopeptide repeat protein [Pseudomonas putida]
MKKIVACLFIAALSQSVWALEAAEQQQLSSIQQSWAHIQYEVAQDQRAAAFERLSSETQAFTAQHPAQAEAWIWKGIVTSSWAGAEGGLAALGKAKTAKADLEKSLSLDPKALQGSAYTSLAALYDRVPGWPIGFGDSDQAEQLLKQALQLNPDGIDSLYFWGDHLYRQKRYAQAKVALQKALQAAPRPGRETADSGRRQEIAALLVDVNKKLD